MAPIATSATTNLPLLGKKKKRSGNPGSYKGNNSLNAKSKRRSSLHLGLDGEPSEVISCDTKFTSRDTKILPTIQSYFLRYRVISFDTKVTFSCVLLSVEGSNFVPQEGT
jgi:hypothetical protein